MAIKKPSELKTKLLEMLVDEANERSLSRPSHSRLVTEATRLQPEDIESVQAQSQSEKSAGVHKSDSFTHEIVISDYAAPDDPPTEAKQMASHLETVVSPSLNQNPLNEQTQSKWSYSQLVKSVPSQNLDNTNQRANVYPSVNSELPENPLVQSEHLRVAQERILELEDLVNRLRIENEQLIAASETLRNRTDELTAKNESLESNFRDRLSILNEEKVLLDTNLKSKAREVQDLKLKVEELELRLNSDLKRIRVRERELENRLELVKMEGSALLRSKDEMILELKRKIDQLVFEMDNYRNKGKELNRRNEAQQERIRRTVKALRLALSQLEGDEGDLNGTKKAE